MILYRGVFQWRQWLFRLEVAWAVLCADKTGFMTDYRGFVLEPGSRWNLRGDGVARWLLTCRPVRAGTASREEDVFSSAFVTEHNELCVAARLIDPSLSATRSCIGEPCACALCGAWVCTAHTPSQASVCPVVGLGSGPGARTSPTSTSTGRRTLLSGRGSW